MIATLMRAIVSLTLIVSHDFNEAGRRFIAQNDLN